MMLTLLITIITIITLSTTVISENNNNIRKFIKIKLKNNQKTRIVFLTAKEPFPRDVNDIATHHDAGLPDNSHIRTNTLISLYRHTYSLEGVGVRVETGC